MKQETTFYLSWLLSAAIILNGCEQLPIKGDEHKPNKVVENNMLRGAEYIKMGKYDIALERLQEALTQDPNYAEAHDVIAVLYELLGKFEEAGKHYETAIILKPNDSDIHNNYGQFLCKQSQWPQAEEHFLKAAKNPLYRTPYIPYTNAGVCALLRKQDPSQAESFFRKALQSQPKFDKALYWMAQTSYNQGFVTQAQDYLKRYLEVAPHTPETLWLGIRIELALNNKKTATDYAAQLRSQYQDSEQTRLLNQLEKPSTTPKP
jgi:type IV pilus assembly protein PilF